MQDKKKWRLIGLKKDQNNLTENFDMNLNHCLEGLDTNKIFDEGFADVDEECFSDTKVNHFDHLDESIRDLLG